MRGACALLLALSVGCSSSSGPPPPGPVELEDAEQMRAFLSGVTFTRVARDADCWTFDPGGTFEAELAGASLRGRWSADMDTLHLSDLEENGVGQPPRALGLRWLDGKLNIEIDGVQYRSTTGFLGR